MFSPLVLILFFQLCSGSFIILNDQISQEVFNEVQKIINENSFPLAALKPNYDSSINEEEEINKKLSQKFTNIKVQWISPTLYSLLCITKLSQDWKNELLTKTHFFDSQLKGDLIFDDQTYNDLKRNPKPESSWYSFLYNAITRIHVKSLFHKSTWGSLFNNIKNKLNRTYIYNYFFKKSPLDQKLQTRLMKQKECNDFILKNYNHLIRSTQLTGYGVNLIKMPYKELINNIIVHNSKQGWNLKEEKLTERSCHYKRNRQIQKAIEIDKNEIKNRLLTIIDHEIKAQHQPYFFAYRAGNTNYTVNENNNIILDEKSYAFSLFQGFFYDSGICPWHLYLAFFRNTPLFQPQLSMVKIHKNEILNRESFWSIPYVTLFESLLSKEETIHMTTKVIYRATPTEEEKRFDKIKPYIVQNNNYATKKITQFNTDLIRLDYEKQADEVNKLIIKNINNNQNLN